MNLQYLSLLSRYRWYILTTVSFFVILTLVFTKLFAPISSNITIFVSLGTDKQALEKSTSFGYEDLINGADKFGETIKGWFKNPGFLDKINAKTDNLLSVNSVKNQALQNIVITLDAKYLSSEKLYIYGLEVLKVLDEEIKLYDEKTKGDFVIATSYVSTGTSYPQYKLNFLTAFVISLFLSIVFFYFYELFLGVVSFEGQLSMFKTVFKLKKEEDFTEVGNYLSIFKNVLIFAGVSIDCLPQASRLSESVNLKNTESIFINYGEKKSTLAELIIGKSPKAIIYVNLPKHAEIYSLKDEVLVAFIRLGHTKLNDLMKIKKLFGGTIVPVVIS